MRNFKIFNLKKITVLLMALLIMVSCGKKENVVDTGSVVVYSSIDEKLLTQLKFGFEKKYPNITMSYYHNSSDKVFNKISDEYTYGNVEADVMFMGNVLDFIKLNKNNFLDNYVSNEAKNINKIFKDDDNTYAAGALRTVGIVYNSDVYGKNAPKSFSDLLDEKYKNKLIMTNPSTANIMKFFVAYMIENEKYGIDYFEKLSEQGLKLVSGTKDTVNEVLNNDDKIAITIDYAAFPKIENNENIEFSYLTDCLTEYIPIGLLKESKNKNNAKKFIDFILSSDGQNIICDYGYIPSKNGVSKEHNVKQIADKNTKIDYDVLYANYNNFVSEFMKIF